jgi:HAMP domain-containing protein
LIEQFSAAFGTRIGRQLLSYLLLANFLITMLSYGWMLIDDYQRGTQRLQNNLLKLEASYENSLAISLWNFDAEQLRTQLEGMLNFDGVEYIAIDSADFGYIETGLKPGEIDIRHQFEVYYEEKGNQTFLATLTILGSYEQLRQQLETRAFNMLLVQLCQTIAISLILLLLIHHLITRHIRSLSDWARTFSIQTPDHPVALQHRSRVAPEKRDELDALAFAIEQMRQSLLSDMQLRDQARIELEDTHNHLNMAIENTTMGFCRYLVREDRMETNRNFCYQLRTDQEALNRIDNPLHAILERLNSDTGVEQRERVYQLLQGRIKRVQGKFSLLKFNGQEGVFDISFQAIRFHNNRPEEVLICSVDHTAEHYARKQLQELNLRMETALRQQQDEFQHLGMVQSSDLDRLRRECDHLRHQMANRQRPSLLSLVTPSLETAEKAAEPTLAAPLKVTIHAFNVLTGPAKQSVDLVKFIQRHLARAKSTAALTTPLSLIIDVKLALIEFLLEHLLIKPSKQSNIIPALTLALHNQTLSMTVALRAGTQPPPHAPWPLLLQGICEEIVDMEINGHILWTDDSSCFTATIKLNLEDL